MKSLNNFIYEKLKLSKDIEIINTYNYIIIPYHALFSDLEDNYPDKSYEIVYGNQKHLTFWILNINDISRKKEIFIKYNHPNSNTRDYNTAMLIYQIMEKNINIQNIEEDGIRNFKYEDNPKYEEEFMKIYPKIKDINDIIK